MSHSNVRHKTAYLALLAAQYVSYQAIRVIIVIMNSADTLIVVA